MRRFTMTLVLGLLLVAPVAAQEPTEPIEPPVEEEPTESQEPVEETTEEATEEEARGDEQAAGTEEVLTPEEQERRRKIEQAAAERAAKREERRLRREAKKEQEEAKQAEKKAREVMKTAERADELIEEGYLLIDEGKYGGARERFQKALELHRGRSWRAQMGLAETELAAGDFALAIRDAQRAYRMGGNKMEEAKALTFAGNATLAARPRDPDEPERILEGSEMFEVAAMRYFIRAAALAPDNATEALEHLERRFGFKAADVEQNRFLDKFLASDPEAPSRWTDLVARAYEAQLARIPPEGQAVAVAGAITPPKRIRGRPVEFTPEEGEEASQWVIVSFEISPQGEVSGVEVLDSVNGKQDQAVARALGQWTYEPGRLPDGQPVTVFWLAAVKAIGS